MGADTVVYSTINMLYTFKYFAETMLHGKLETNIMFNSFSGPLMFVSFSRGSALMNEKLPNLPIGARKVL